MSFYAKNWVFQLTSVKTEEMSSLGCGYKVMLTQVVPIRTLYIFVNLFWYVILGGGISIRSNIYNIDLAIIASW